MSTIEYAQFSNTAIMFAAVVYSLALLAHIAEWALHRAPAPDRDLIAVGANSSHEATTAAATISYREDFAGRFGVALTVIGLALNAAGMVTRGLAAERVPWGNMYEFTITGCVATVATYLVLLRFQPIRWLGLPVTGLVVVLLMIAVLLLDIPAGPLVPALHSYWLYIHVTAAKLATGAFTVGALASCLYLSQSRAEARGRSRSGLAARLPDGDTIDRLAYRVHAFGFPLWTFAALIAGPIWARYAWGRYWGWDPKEVWAFITWVAYAAYLHARATAGWRGRKASVLALVGFAALLFNFVGINLWGGGLHSYAGK